MYKLISCCLLLIGFLNPFLSRPVINSSEESPLLSATDEDARLILDRLERASRLQILPEMLGAEREGKEDPTANIFNPRGRTRKAFSRQDPNIFLSHPPARNRKPHKKQKVSSECFWKYCV